jgi:REP element-mobilizing transposase RayT
MESYRRNIHTRFDTTFHLEWIRKYRQKLLQADVGIRLRQLEREICSELEWRSSRVTDESR